MWKCKECGKEVTGLGGITYETCGLLDKKGNIKKHEILEEIDSDTDFYRCNSCVDEKNYSKEIGEQILLERLYDKIWFGLGFALGMANKNEEVQENER